MLNVLLKNKVYLGKNGSKENSILHITNYTMSSKCLPLKLPPKVDRSPPHNNF